MSRRGSLGKNRPVVSGPLSTDTEDLDSCGCGDAPAMLVITAYYTLACNNPPVELLPFIDGEVDLRRATGAGPTDASRQPSALLHWTLSNTCPPIRGRCVGVAAPRHRTDRHCPAARMKDDARAAVRRERCLHSFIHWFIGSYAPAQGASVPFIVWSTTPRSDETLFVQQLIWTCSRRE